MKTFKLDNEPKINTGFTVPENYFEDFSAKMMQQLPETELKLIPIYGRKKTWMYAVAAILVLSLSIPIYTNYFSNSSEIDATTLENYITYHSTVSDSDLVNLMDDDDIQKMEVELKIEDKTIENELIDNKNLEQYLLN
jgi:hypothetical protein